MRYLYIGMTEWGWAPPPPPQLESEGAQLRDSLAQAEERYRAAEKRVDHLTRRLSEAQTIVEELEQGQDRSTALENEMAEVKGRVVLRNAEIKELEMVRKWRGCSRLRGMTEKVGVWSIEGDDREVGGVVD